MKTLTRRKALEITRDMWAWLAKNPDKDKYGSPQNLSQDLLSGCACCEFAAQKNTIRPGLVDCSKCPLNGKWGYPKQFKHIVGNAPCENARSPYYKWQNYKEPKYRTRYALAISNAAKLELAKLKRK